MSFGKCEKILFVSLVVAVCLAALGCKGQAPTSNPESSLPATPKEALVRAVTALHQGDTTAFFAVVQANDRQREFLQRTIEFLKASADFKEAFIKAYGQEAWVTFQDPAKGPTDGNATLTIADPSEHLARVQTAPIDERGTEATCEVPEKNGPPKKIRMINTPSGWQVDGGSMCPDEATMSETAPKAKRLAEVIRKYQRAIGRPGIKPEDIDAELGKAIAQVLTGVNPPGPRRFDIDNLPGGQ